MRKWWTRSLLFTLCFVAATPLNAASIKHNFIAIDEGLGNLLHIDERDSSRNWIVPIGRPQARDMRLVGGNRILIGHNNGYSEFDLATGKLLTEVSSFSGVTSVRRLPNGNTLIGGVNLDGSAGVVVLETDSKNTVLHKTVYPGNYVRLIRQTPQDTFLMGCDTLIKEGDGKGAFIWEAQVDQFRHAWKAVRLPGGNTLASAGYGAFMVELDRAGKVVRKFGQKGAVPEAVNPNFYATFQLMPNGDVVLANWQGHGPGHGSSGIQLLEYNKKGKIVWQWSKPEKISSLQGILVLDKLDTRVLHDERNGVMKPLK